MGWLSGITKSIGNIFNDISGANSAMKQQYNYNKEFAQNAHQWEVKDMEAAGLNPILSADGSGAQGNVSAVAGGGSQMIGNLINSILDYNIMGKQNEIAQQDVNAKTALAQAEKESTEAKTIEQVLRNEQVPNFLKAEIANKWANTNLQTTEANLTNAKTQTEMYNKYNAQQDWYIKHEQTQQLFWNNINNESEAKFVQKYGMTKDQAIQMFEKTGNLITNIGKNRKTTTSAKGNNNVRK